MAKTKISEYSATANNNTDINSINLAEGMAPSLVNNAIRQLMAQLKDFQAGTAGDSLTVGGNLSVTGTSTLTGAITATGGVSGAITSSSATITGGTITGITDLAVADGGTGASTAVAALNNLLPSQTSNANKYLQTDGTNASWDAVSLSTADITGTLAVANGGTGVTSSTGTVAVVLSNSPTLVTPALGTPSALVGTNITGTASGLTAGNVTTNANLTGAVTSVGNATSLGSFTSAQLLGALTDETGTGSAVFATSPTLVTPALGTPSALVGTNITGTAAGLTAGNVTTNANLTGAITSVGNAASLGSFSSANLLAALTDETGTGSAVFATSPTLVTPILGTPTSATLTNATGLPIATGVSGLGTGVATALAVNVGSSGAPLVNGGVLGTPSSGTATNLTGLPLSTGVTGTLPVANGGTGTATPSIVAGTNVTVTGTWPNQTIASTAGGSGTVTSVAATVPSVFSISGSPITTSGTLAMTYSGTALPVVNGGTGQTSYTDGQLLIGNSTGNTLTKTTLTAGSNITITNAAGAITIAASGGGTPAGSTTQVQYNNAGAFAGSANLTFDGSNLTAAGLLGPHNGTVGAITPATGAFTTLSATGGSAGGAGAYTAIFKNSDNANSGSIQLGGTTYGALIYRDSVGANSELIFVNSHNGNKGFKFFTGSNIQGTTQLAAIGATGCIAVGTATPSSDGSGITFPATQSASTDANTLDDYEEGTFTPAITGSSTNPTVGYGNQIGNYTKIGNVVNFTLWIQWTSISGGSGDARFSGLPFTSQSGSEDFFPTSVWFYNLTYSNSSPVGLLVNNSTYLLISGLSSGGGFADVAVSNLGASGEVRFTGTYYV